jgi:hypothetical protein
MQPRVQTVSDFRILGMLFRKPPAKHDVMFARMKSLRNNVLDPSNPDS